MTLAIQPDYRTAKATAIGCDDGLWQNTRHENTK